MSRAHIPISPERQAVLYQETVDSAHRNIDSLHMGHECAASFLLECLRERVWEHPRKLSMSDAPPMSFDEFVKKGYPHGLGSSYEKLEEIIAVGIDPHAKSKNWPNTDLELRRLWQEISGRKLPPMTPTQDIQLDSVRVPDNRKRALVRDRVTSLADSIKSLGLLNPITIAMDRTLVAGLHRLEACRSLGLKTITARVAHLDDLHRELAEIDENLVRAELTTLERAEHLARRKAIYESLHPETKRGVAGANGTHRVLGRGKASGSDATEIISVASFDADTAKQTGQSARTIRQEVQIATSLTPETKAAIKDTPLADKKVELLELAREKDPGKQLQLADAVKSGEAKSVKEAKAKLAPPATPPTEPANDNEPTPSAKPKRVRFDGDIKLSPDARQSAQRIREKFGDEYAKALKEAL